ncbi:putative ABC transporter substrate-binding lipoprotein YvrC [Synergistales bacterium]|nr:putative ABC transporter substrate-binding lipoprotein YvrC [Synergistales bacterium]
MKIYKSLFLILAALLFCAARYSQAEDDMAASARILSLAPVATEILFDLGIGERVVGVTEYCTWPPEAKSKTNIGEMMNVNMEVVASLKPDIVALSNMNVHLRGQFEAFGIPVVVVYQDDFEQICGSILRVGEVCGVAAAARLRVEALRKEVSDLSAKGKSGARVLIAVGRDQDESFRAIYVAGPLSFYNNLLAEAGAENAFTGNVPYANISREGLIRIDPDIIIELVGEHGTENLELGAILAQWDKLPYIRAVSSGRVFVIRGDFAFRAGPRYPKLLDAFSRIINGGVREVNE